MRMVGLSNDTPSPALLDSGQKRLTRLVHAHGAFVWRVLRRWGLSPVDADDASQSVFMILAQKLDQLSHDTERAFLYGVAMRVAANTRRGNLRRGNPDEAALEHLMSPTHGPEKSVQQSQELVELDQLLLKLPEELRRVLILAQIEGMTSPEIATLEGIALGTVASRLRRARRLFEEEASASATFQDRIKGQG
jgi:RNA polymerase sigma-70 factor (ECF subfamily)